jgi:hypothetical protein
MDSFTRAQVRPGADLIKTLQTDTSARPANPPLEAGFMTWNRIRILTPRGATTAGAAGMLRIVLNQAYHTGWKSPNCTLTRGDQDNLVANCPARTLQAGPIDLVFSDPVSELGAEVSVRAAVALTAVIGLLGLMSLIPKRRPVTAPSVTVQVYLVPTGAVFVPDRAFDPLRTSGTDSRMG